MTLLPPEDDGTDPSREYVLENAHGIRVHLVPVGASLRALYLPDREGRSSDVVLGFESGSEYERNGPYFGCTVGRFANRIDRGRFALDGETFQVSTNEGEHHLHGGHRGLGARLWRVLETRESPPSIAFEIESVDGDEGYPGNAVFEMRYTLTEDDELILEERARTDRPTIVNLTNHTYFNLADGGASSILDHELELLSSELTVLRDDGIPTGERASVEGTPFDFRTARRIGERIAEVRRGPIGYDHNFIVDGWDGSLRPVARLHDPSSARTLEIASTKPGIQFYSGNFLDGSVIGKGGVAYAQHAGLCLETQFFPDAPNHPDFPSTRLAPGEEYVETTVFRFSLR